MSDELQVYMCSVFNRKEWVDGLRVWLEENYPFKVVSRWHQISHQDTGEDIDKTGWSRLADKVAREDLEDIDKADVIVCCTEEKVDETTPQAWRGGRHVELGYAMGKGMPIVVLGRREATFYHIRTHYVVGTSAELAYTLQTLNKYKRNGTWQERGLKVRDYHMQNRLGTLTPAERVRFWTLALCGEAGELANQVKKEWRGDPENDYEVNVRSEIADVRIYLQRLADELGYDIDKLCQEKIDKLYKRLSLGEQ